MNSPDVIQYYWKYYLSIEKQIIELERFIEFDLQINGNTYSAKLLELLQSICNEIDTVGKVLARIYDPTFHSEAFTSIKRWWHIVQCNNSQILNEPVVFRKETLLPWKGFHVTRKNNQYCIDSSSPGACIPIWWDSHNDVKHRRTDCDENGRLFYTHASLSNVINAMAGLYILEVVLLEQTDCIVDSSELFSVEGHHVFRNYVLWDAT